MKQCTYCGKEYPEDVLHCALDGQPVTTVSAWCAPDGRYRRYEDVPWYRREPRALAHAGVLFCGVATLAFGVICLTGDVYENAYDNDGNLKVWGLRKKLAVILILGLQILVIWGLQVVRED